MTDRLRVAFAYRFGVIGGVSTQLANRISVLSDEFDFRVIYSEDHGMAARLPPLVAEVAETPELQTEALRRINPDVLIVIDSPEYLVAWRALGQPFPAILEVHTTTANVAYLQELADPGELLGIMTVSEYMRSRLEAADLTEHPIVAVPNCLDSLWMEPAEPVDLGYKPILWVGKLDGHKRVLTVVEMMDSIVSQVPGARPVFVGGYTAGEDRVRHLLTSLKNRVNLRNALWLPSVEYELMPRLFASAGSSGGIMLTATRDESFGMAVAEALVQGCPVVAPSVGALPELLPQAAMYPPRDYAAGVSLSVAMLTEEETRREGLSTAASVKQAVDPEVAARAYGAALHELLETTSAAVDTIGRRS
jgi:glycosyltransferase involved in cell wall biosynthesis